MRDGGFSLLVRGDRLLLSSVALALLLVMAVGGFQGLVLPAYYSSMGTPELVGFVTSACSLGTLVGSPRLHALRPRSEQAALVRALVPGHELRDSGDRPAARPASDDRRRGVLGFSAGPLAALLNFFVFDSVPEVDRGSVLGTQNALYLAASPASMFLCSAMVTAVSV